MPKGFNTAAVSTIVIGSIMHIEGRRQKRERRTAWVCIYLSITLILSALPVQAYTTGVHGVKFTSDGFSSINETTANYSWMEAILPVHGKGISHYHFQGPVFESDWEECHGQSFTSIGGYLSSGEDGQREEVTCYPSMEIGYGKGTARNQYNQVITDLAHLWQSSNETVGTIVSTGLFEARAVGATTITAANGSMVGNATIPEEEDSFLTTIAISPYFPAIYTGTSLQLEATAYDEHGTEIPNISVVWASSNKSVGTVDLDGLFQALAPGTTEITATNGSSRGATIATVLPIPLALWGPYVTNTSSSSATIHWKTDNATTGTVKYANETYYAEQGGYDRSVEDGVVIQLHHLTLTNLTPDTLYQYQVVIQNRSTGDCSFRTFPLNGSFTFIVYGDSQEPQGDPSITQLNRHKLVADRVAGEENVTFVLHCGDLVNDGGDLEEWNRFFEAARTMMATTTIYPTLGNHEYTNYSGFGEAVQNYYAAFAMPAWYSFDCSGAHVTVLDSNDQADISAETAWLLNELRTSATWKFVVFHHPPYSSSDKNYGGWTNLRELWSPPIKNSSIAAVFNGHVHAYERLRTNGITYVVTGTGGGPLYKLREPRIPESQATLEETLGYVKVTVNADHKTASLAFIKVATISNGRITLFAPGSEFEKIDLLSNPTVEPTTVMHGSPDRSQPPEEPVAPIPGFGMTMCGLSMIIVSALCVYTHKRR